ncbi:hypothetical protein SCG7086_AI_00130 [Chlamydiales bacterium SCGC AG-110-P3]|nr:hypothetical protein SCG7086_AI_00130 [Chlamydiales bacterium SCGC AG-110-P3]
MDRKQEAPSLPTNREEKQGPSSLKYRQGRKEISPQGVGLDGDAYPARKEFRAIPDVENGMEDAYLKTVSEVSGTFNEMLGQKLIYQAIHASPGAKEIDVEAEAVTAALGEMKPQDAVEGLLITQMTALHNQMMHYMRASIDEEYRAEEYISRFLKLNRQFLATLKGLLRYRNRGQQNVIVQNVNVGPDGKAIVGCIQTPYPTDGR